MGLRGPKPGSPQRGGWKKKVKTVKILRQLLPKEERKIQSFFSVKRKFYNEAVKEVQELLKKYQ